MSGRSGTETPPTEASANADGGGSGRALKLQTDTPHLVNIGGDRLSTSVTLHAIPQGRVTLGSGAGVDIPVHGTGVLPLHCHIENSEGIVTIYPLSDNLSIDGVKINRPTRLSQGVMLTIGRSNYMRFNHPAEARMMKSVLPNPRISMAAIQIEAESSEPQFYHQKYNKKPPAVPKKNFKTHYDQDSDADGPIPSNIMMKVSKFEYLAQQNFKKTISPKVFSSNLVTVNTPAKDVLGKSPPDIQHFAKSLPRNVLNYSESHCNDSKTPERSMFGKKSPQYVNVTLNDSATKGINNRVIIYENGSTSNQALNNKKNNVNKPLTPSPNYNRCTSPYFRSVTPSPPSSQHNYADLQQNRRSGSMGEISGIDGDDGLRGIRNADAEMRRHVAHQERIKEQEIGKAEQARLEEILNMCVEYENQVQCEKNKVTHNRIITNGSLPRDKRQFGAHTPTYTTTPPPSPLDVDFSKNEQKRINYSYENVTSINNNRQNKKYSSYENVDLRMVDVESKVQNHTSQQTAYENVTIGPSQNNTPSPRTRIKTIVPSHRDNQTKDATAEIIENKFALYDTEPSPSTKASAQNGQSSPKFKFPSSEQPNKDHQKIERMKSERKSLQTEISTTKRHMADLETHEEELNRDLELERALIAGETKSKHTELRKLEALMESLQKQAQQIETNMVQGQARQETDQSESRERLLEAQAHMDRTEKKLTETDKNDAGYEQVFEEYLKAQELLDNEKKTFEDLEFHHLEEEADWLASREEVQREIIDVSSRIETIQVHINDLEEQKVTLVATNNRDIKTLRRKHTDLLYNLERATNALRHIDYELSSYAHPEDSEQDESTDSDVSDKSKDLDKQLSRLSLHRLNDMMSCSVVISNDAKTPLDHVYNMSQSFNEKLLHEKAILEPGVAMRYPSQDDIDRISKVTMGAPINIDEEQGSLGRKTIESLKDIERKRHLHLCQQGSQVIEQERQRVQALKERVQQEVRLTWEQRRQDCISVTSNEDETAFESKEIIETDAKPESPTSPNSIAQNESNRIQSDSCDSPRPLSETSEMSVEVGNAATKRPRRKTTSTSPNINDKQRPLTRYLPIRGSDLDLRKHIESAGHQVVACPHVIINATACRGFLHKKGSKLNGWSKRWFVFDRNKHTFTYYNDKSERKARGGAYFQAIEEVYLDHLNSVKSPNPQLTFIVKTHQRLYYLMAPSPESMRIWVDVIFTGAEGYQEFEHGT